MVIYKTTNLINGKWYIGKDSKNNSRYLGNGILLRKAINKYGKDNFIKEILEYLSKNCSLEDLSKAEIKWIKITGAGLDPKSYNLTFGGDGGNNTPETISKMAAINKINAKNTDRNKKLSKSLIKFNKENPGAIVARIDSLHKYFNNDKAREASSISSGGKEFKVFLVSNRKCIWQGFSMGLCAKRLRISRSCVKNCLTKRCHQYNGYIFRYLGEEYLPIKSKCKKIRNLETGEIFDTIRDAAKMYRFSRNNISRAIKMGAKCGGYRWEYLNASY